MAPNRNIKKKQKQAKRKKTRLRSKDKALRYEKAEEYAWEADRHYRQSEFLKAHELAMKGLRGYPKHKGCYYYAWSAANKLSGRQSLFEALKHGWQYHLIEERQHLYVLGQLAYSRRDWKLGQDVFEAFLKNPEKLSQMKALTHELKQARYFAKCCKEFQKKASPQKKKTSGAGNQPLSSPSAGKSQSKQKQAPSKTASDRQQDKRQPSQASPVQPEEELPELEIIYDIHQDSVLQVIQEQQPTDSPILALLLQAYKLSFRTSYDQLICLPSLHEVESLWYQEETARKVMKTLRGRAILADEVGLGKTIEASLILKEYILRGLVKSALILVPSSLVDQWQEELSVKFGLTVVSSNDPLFREDPETFWQQPFLLVSLQTARMKRYFQDVTARSYDMVIVDEAHHLKNRTTANWKLVNTLQEPFLLLLTATPVQNKLEELYNLVTLLKPGHLKTRKAFMAEFVARGNPTDPRNREKLRELLKEVMVRNTRSVAHLRLPPRFASTIQVSPSEPEALFYQKMSQFVTEQAANGSKKISKMLLRRLLEAAGSSHFAALKMLKNMNSRSKERRELLATGTQIGISTKSERVLELLNSSSEKTIVFVNYLQTLEYLRQILQTHKISHVVYRGGMTPAQKHKAIEQFQKERQVLLATDTGGEGHNLQFCHTMINYDLPWNPMRIEQRIGRIHRFGQKKGVQVYNFCAAGSIEDYILDILDRKINMFELVVGEIDMILGHLKGEQEFSEMVYEMWVSHTDDKERKQAFTTLGTRMKRAKTAYQKSKDLDEKIFQEDFGV